jgi:hypothetical protein
VQLVIDGYTARSTEQTILSPDSSSSNPGITLEFTGPFGSEPIRIALILNSPSDSRANLGPQADVEFLPKLPTASRPTTTPTYRETQMVLARDPSLRGLTPSLRSRLFQLWHARGPRDQLLRLLKQDSTLLADGWRWVAEESASNRNFEAAYQLVRKFGGRPSIPSLKSSSAVSELERKFVYQPSDRVVGLMLAQAQQRAGSHSDAIRTVRQLRRLPDPPAYLAQMEAELHAQLNQWESAWTCWKNSTTSSPRQP